MGRHRTGNKDWSLNVKLSKRQQEAVNELVKAVDGSSYTSLVKAGLRILCEQNKIVWPKDSDE